jgi:hypothetical protein
LGLAAEEWDAIGKLGSQYGKRDYPVTMSFRRAGIAHDWR